MSRKEGYSLPKDVEESQRARFLNEEIKDLYWIRLIQCWQCSTIISIPFDKEWDIICRTCWNVDEECHFPDLFY